MTGRVAQDIIRRVAQGRVVALGTAVGPDYDHIGVQRLGRFHDFKKCDPAPYAGLYDPTGPEHPLAHAIQFRLCRRVCEFRPHRPATDKYHLKTPQPRHGFGRRQLRVTVGTQAENDRFLACLRELG